MCLEEMEQGRRAQAVAAGLDAGAERAEAERKAPLVQARAVIAYVRNVEPKRPIRSRSPAAARNARNVGRL